MQIVQPEAIGFSGKRLARINRVMQRYVDEGKLAGISTLIARRGQVVHFETFGQAEVETARPMAFDTIFRIYSMTKPITSAAVLMLLEEGRLRLTDPVAHYLPAFKGVKVLDNAPGSGVRFVEPTRPMTIHDLLTHTAGLSYGFDDNVYIDELYRTLWEKLDANPAFTLANWIEALAGLPLAYHPGARYRYSMATDVLGYLVEVIAAMPFGEFLQQRIFAPLGMVDTDFYVPQAKIERFAATYGPGEGGLCKWLTHPPPAITPNPTSALRGEAVWFPPRATTCALPNCC